MNIDMNMGVCLFVLLEIHDQKYIYSVGQHNTIQTSRSLVLHANNIKINNYKVLSVK